MTHARQAHPFPEKPVQLLGREAYISDEWFRSEQKNLFSKTWQFVGMAFDVAKAGDYLTATVAGHPIFVLRTQDGSLSAFHNLCRHRGTELFEGSGNTGKTIVCPYHRWTYGLDGQLRGLPEKQLCFPDFDRANHNLLPIEVGEFKDMVFVNLTPHKAEPFEEAIGSLSDVAWPHDITCGNLKASEEFVYDIKCNWKVFCENALDGYHLAYLHENTLGGPVAGQNIWEASRRNLIWYSTERDGAKNRIPKFVEEQAGSGATKIAGAEDTGYGGVYLLFPNTLVTPSPWSLTISRIEPVSAEQTRLIARTWVPDSWFSYKEKPEDAPGYDPETKTICSDYWTEHPLETGDFQTEDIWVCEKMQRSLNSPAYRVGQMAAGSGGEAALEVFQRNVLDYIGA